MKLKKIVSFTLTIIFLFLIGITFLWSIQIQNFKKNDFLHNQSLSFFKVSEFNNLQRIVIKNSNSEFIFEKNKENTSLWSLVSPQKMEIDQKFLIELLTDTSSLTTIKILPQDEINKSNFAIDTPTSQVTLIDVNNQTKILKVGILNTIDQTTYITLSNKNGIYHIEVNKLKFIHLNLSDLNSQKIFNFDLNQISSFQINKKNTSLSNVSFKNNQWINNSNQIIETLKIESLFLKLNEIKFVNIETSNKENLKKQINSDEKLLIFTLLVLNQNQSQTEFKVYGPMKETGENNYLIKYNNEIFYTNKKFIELLTNYHLANFNI